MKCLSKQNPLDWMWDLGAPEVCSISATGKVVSSQQVTGLSRTTITGKGGEGRERT